MADPLIQESKFKRKVTLSSGVTSAVGSLLYHDGTNYALADASSKASYAQLVALQIGTAEEIEAAPYVVLADADAPYTQDKSQYLSETGGATTETRPTTVKSLRQIVGRAHSTSLIEYDLRTSEVTVPIVVKFASSANALLDSGNFGGATLDAQNEVCLLQAELPENFLEVSKAVLRVAAEATSGTPTVDITVGANGGDDTDHDAITADATLTNQASEGTGADDVKDINIATGLDATDIAQPGHSIGIKCTKDDSGTDIVHILGGQIICLVAG